MSLTNSVFYGFGILLFCNIPLFACRCGRLCGGAGRPVKDTVRGFQTACCGVPAVRGFLPPPVKQQVVGVHLCFSILNPLI